MDEKRLIIEKVYEEQFQRHGTRKELYFQVEENIGIPIVSFFTSFRYPVMIENSDADMLEGILRESDLSKGFALILSSPGGDSLAAERIINILRSYGKDNEYAVIVPGKAKSAATMICLGAQRILMSRTSELGPIDPQITYREGNRVKRFSIFNIVKSYEDLFEKATNVKGRIEPYLQQLANYDVREVEEFKSALELSKDIAIKVLKTGMMKDKNESEIKEKIKIFLTPEEVKTHGRPIYAKDAQNCGLNIEIIDLMDPIWKIIYELYVRLDNYVSTNNVAKVIESKHISFSAKIGR